MSAITQLRMCATPLVNAPQPVAPPKPVVPPQPVPPQPVPPKPVPPKPVPPKPVPPKPVAPVKTRAVSLKGKIWPAKSIILVSFMGEVPPNLKLVTENTIAKQRVEVVKGQPVSIYLDPQNKPVATKNPYRNANGNIIDQNNNPVIFDPLEELAIKAISEIQTATVQKIKGVPKDEYFDFYVCQVIKEIILRRIEPYVNLTFVFTQPISTPIDGEIRISFDQKSGCWSKIGTDSLSVPKNQATMNFAWFSVADVMHQFGHALGLVHEHQRPDRDARLAFNLPLIYNWAKTVSGRDDQTIKSNIIDKLDQTQINDPNFYKNNSNPISLIGFDPFSFDPESIMLDFFPADVTLDPVTGKPPGKGTTQNRRLSKKDVVILNMLYPGDGTDKITVFKSKISPSTGRVRTFEEIVPQYRMSADNFYFDTYGEHIQPWNKIKFVFKTSDDWFSGTDAVINLGLINKYGNNIVEQVTLQEDKESMFESGETDIFTIERPDIDRETLNKDIILTFVGEPYNKFLERDLVTLALSGGEDWKVEKISIYYNDQFVKSYTPDVWMGNGANTVKTITLSSDNYDINFKENFQLSNLKENFQLGFDTSDTVGFSLTIGLIILGVIILSVLLYFSLKKKGKKI